MVRIAKRRGRIFIMEGTQGFEPCYTWLTAKCVTTTLNARKVVFVGKEVVRLGKMRLDKGVIRLRKEVPLHRLGKPQNQNCKGLASGRRCQIRTASLVLEKATNHIFVHSLSEYFFISDFFEGR